MRASNECRAEHALTLLRPPVRWRCQVVTNCSRAYFTNGIAPLRSRSHAGEHEWALKLLAANVLNIEGSGDSSGCRAESSVIESGTAVIIARMGRIETALRRFFRSLRDHGRNGDCLVQAHDLTNLGHLLQGIGRLSESQRCFRFAAQRCARFGL